MKEELDLEILASQLAYAQDAVKELQEKLEQAKKEQEPWEPKSGQFIVRVDGGTARSEYGHFVESAPFGMVFQTLASAQHTKPFFRFYHRLCQLAIELNPSGNVGGNWYVFWETLERPTAYWEFNGDAARAGCWYLFETKEAAQKACDIMNRDKWRLPK